MTLLSLTSLVAVLFINVESASHSMIGKYTPPMQYLDLDQTNTLFKNTGKPRLLCEAGAEPCFSYDRSSPIGPYCWGKINGHHTRCCDANGSFQSPISIPRPKRTICTHKKLRYLSSSTTGKVENVGVYPEYFANDTKHVMLTGVPGSNHRFILDNVHIHSGVRGAYRQTENLLFGRSFSAEAHVVHHRSDFKDVAEASQHPGGIAVISIFLTNERERYNPTTNKALDIILDKLDQIIEFTEEEHACRAENERISRHGIFSKLGLERVCRENDHLFDSYADESNRCQLHRKALGCGQPIDHVTFDPNDLLSTKPKYLTFEGGLTTPPCSEAVIWIVAETPAYISDRNIEYMNKLKSRIVNQTISDFGNLRPLQDPAERDVFRIIYGREEDESDRREEGEDRKDGHDIFDEENYFDDNHSEDYYEDDYFDSDSFDDDSYDEDRNEDGRRLNGIRRRRGRGGD